VRKLTVRVQVPGPCPAFESTVCQAILYMTEAEGTDQPLLVRVWWLTGPASQAQATITHSEAVKSKG
jgi:hypothetical protein